MNIRGAFVIGFALIGSIVHADFRGIWKGATTLGASRITLSSAGDSLVKLQMSKAFMKRVKYQFDFSPKGTFTSLVNIPDAPPREGKGTWVKVGNVITISFQNEAGKKSQVVLRGVIGADAKKMVITMPGKNGLPDTKLILQQKS